ncbi:small glutamine-rich tetratricopeptide repeat-containing protein beta-like isoform X2 [Dreissena polymorpha]|uniref:small glutamine-rich tetratricopeptide repeat-containing protein beta-like isoform X2 n=1 Tax=Dreissena polymorpha TaxID=45954 RepID=UPI002264CAB7|nr:small glutamine-rich tetratricopeptide repeat-containing protein beta-like isoform X2 [Dreissena polymorpha]
MADVKKLVFSIIRFLQDQRTSNTLEEEQAESLEVAIQCLESSYSIDSSDEQTVAKYHVQRNLLDIFNAQMSLELPVCTADDECFGVSASTTAADADFTELSLHEATPEEKEEAEILKNKGNDFMKSEKFSDAIESYSQALKLDNKNAVYYCNRAAAYSKISKHKSAIEDCQRALTIDPLYSKAYGRMGIAYTALEDHESAFECYRKALELDPDNQSYQNNLEIAEQKLQESAANAGFGMGLGGGMPGMPGIGALLNNPAMMQMAQQMMSNPEMQNMMANMMQGMSQGGQGGDFNSILQMGQQMAQQMQAQNPELVNQLREQMGRPPNPPGDGDQPPASGR